MTTNLDMIRGRSNVVTMANNSGDALIAGDVCIQDTSGDEYVTTTTSANSAAKVFIAAESIAAAGSGRFYESGYVPYVNVSASATRGHFAFTHTVAKQAATSATHGVGAFGRILKAGTTPSMLLYPTSQIVSASDTAAGIVELATAAETTTGTDATRAVTPDGLAGSNFGIRLVQLYVIEAATSLTTGDGKTYFWVPTELNGMNLVSCAAMVDTVSSSGTPTVQIRNVTDSVDMLSTRITIDINEKTSYTAAAAAVIDATKDDVATGDQLAVDVDTAGTGTKGLWVQLGFQLP